MKYNIIEEAKFISRPNRFVAFVDIDGAEERVHVKNTGRCKELLVPGYTVYLEEGTGTKRNTKYSIIAVQKGEILINMDSQAPNKVAFDALINGEILEIGEVDFAKREVVFGNSRFDLYYEKDDKKGFIEVKGVTLENHGTAMFPDAPTARGKKHVKELIKAKESGYEAAILFLIQMEGMNSFTVNYETDKSFADALNEAKEAGVDILVYDCIVTESTMNIGKRVHYFL